MTDEKELDSIQNEKTLFRSLSNTFRSVITPSWLTGLVKTVKETAKAEDTVPTKKEFEEMEVAANFHSSNLHQKSMGQLPVMSDKAVQQRQEILKDIPLQHFSSQKVVHNYEESSDTSIRKNGSSDAGNVLQSNNYGFCPPYKKICNTKSRNFHQSPFYSGKTRFGGAMSSQRMNNSVGSLSSNKVPYVVRHKIKARERMRTSTSSAKKILETLHKIRPSYDVPVDFGNGKAEFTLPAESIARLSHGLLDEKHETPVKMFSVSKDSRFTFSTPAEKQDVSKETHLLPKMMIPVNIELYKPILYCFTNVSLDTQSSPLVPPSKSYLLTSQISMAGDLLLFTMKKQEIKRNDYFEKWTSEVDLTREGDLMLILCLHSNSY